MVKRWNLAYWLIIVVAIGIGAYLLVGTAHNMRELQMSVNGVN